VQLLIVFLLIVSPSVYAFCHYTPMPPFPPSPPEFKTPVIWHRTGNGFQISWAEIPDKDGYFVSVCNDERGYLPVATGVQGNSFSLTGFDKPGNHHVLVTAYVEVGGNLVFNTGALTTIPVAKEDVTLTPDEVLDPAQIAELPGQEQPGIPAPTSVEVGRRSVLVKQYPTLEGSRSFYSPQFPFVVNPMVSQAGPRGEQVPVLLTDAAIDRTVARVQGRAARTPVEQIPVVQVSEVEAVKSTTAVASDLVGVSSSPNLQEKLDRIASQNKGPLSATTASAPVTAPVVTPSQSAERPASEPIPSAPSQNQWMNWLAIVVLAGFLYFIFAKEAK